MSNYCITYHIDKYDRIVHISNEWQAFADRNKAKNLTTEIVLKQSIFSFISDKESRHIYEMLFARCREKNATFHFPFRCDSPQTRRFMQMTLSPLAEGAIAITSCIEREELRKPMVLLDIDRERSEEFLSICSWCKKVRLEDQSWVEVEDAIEQLKLFDALALPRLTHGMCEACHDEQIRLLYEGD